MNNLVFIHELMNDHDQSLSSSKQSTKKESPVSINPDQLGNGNKNLGNKNSNSHDIERKVLWRGKGRKLSQNRLQKRSISSYYRSKAWRMQLVYMAKGNNPNIFTPERLKTIHQIEMNITHHPDFTKFCAKNVKSREDPALGQIGHCLPPNSLMTYFFPSQVNDVVSLFDF